MTAVIEPVAPAKQRRETHPGIEATAVQPLGAREQLGQCRGLHLLQTHSTLFGEFVEAHDVIEVDFDVRHINCDAEFLIAYHCADDRSWYGVRRFQRRPNKELWIADPGLQGREVTWKKVAPDALRNIEVFGIVREVFKPYSKIRARHG